MEDNLKKPVVKPVVKKTTQTSVKKVSTENKAVVKPSAKKAVSKVAKEAKKDDVAFTKLQEENRAMQDKMNKMERLMQELSDKMVNTNVENVATESTNELKGNEYIKVISLVDGLLNLWTEPNHKGRLYGFSKFGQQKEIQYNDIAGILDNQEKFVNQGCLYVLDKRVIDRHYLAEKYEKFLDKEMIQKLLESDDKSDYELFKSTSDKQKEIIIRLYIEKVSDLPEDEIDFNKLEFFAKNSNKNIKERIEEFKNFKK